MKDDESVLPIEPIGLTTMMMETEMEALLLLLLCRWDTVVLGAEKEAIQ